MDAGVAVAQVRAEVRGDVQHLDVRPRLVVGARPQEAHALPSEIAMSYSNRVFHDKRDERDMFEYRIPIELSHLQSARRRERAPSGGEVPHVVHRVNRIQEWVVGVGLLHAEMRYRVTLTSGLSLPHYAWQEIWQSWLIAQQGNMAGLPISKSKSMERSPK